MQKPSLPTLNLRFVSKEHHGVAVACLGAATASFPEINLIRIMLKLSYVFDSHGDRSSYLVVISSCHLLWLDMPREVVHLLLADYEGDWYLASPG